MYCLKTFFYFKGSDREELPVLGPDGTASELTIWELEIVFGHKENYTAAYKTKKDGSYPGSRKDLSVTDRQGLLAQAIDIRMLTSLISFLGVYSIVS